MVISREVQEKFRTTTSDGRTVLVDIPPRNAHTTSDQASVADVAKEPENKTGRWTNDEHQRFMVGIELFPAGPWKKVAEVVGTRNERQTMTHAQKYWMKIKRHRNGLKRGQSRFPSRDESSGVSPSSAPVVERQGDDQDTAEAVADDDLEPLDATEDHSVRVYEGELFLMLFGAPMEDADGEL
jgi:SHAQKYF class myb-like DNA-binding protein